MGMREEDLLGVGVGWVDSNDVGFSVYQPTRSEAPREGVGRRKERETIHRKEKNNL